MIIDALAVEPSSNCLKGSIREEQRDVVSVAVRLKGSSPHPRFNLEGAAFIAPITTGTDLKTII